MHPRQRSPRGFYASEYRHRGGGGGGGDVGFGRGYNNRRGPASAAVVVPGAAAVVPGGGGDIFVEAGRLAAEYLVSQGLLPPSVLSLKLYNNQNGSFKKHVGVGVGVGGGVVGGVGLGEISVDGGRASVLARLGNNAVPIVDGGLSAGRRKLGFEEFGEKGGSRRRGSFNSNGFDWGNREYRRNGSWSDRFGGGSDIREDDDNIDGGIGRGAAAGATLSRCSHLCPVVRSTLWRRDTTTCLPFRGGSSSRQRPPLPQTALVLFKRVFASVISKTFFPFSLEVFQNT